MKKVVLPKDFGFFILPTTQKALKVFGINSSLIQITNMLSEESGTSSPISKASIHRLTTIGVSEKLADKFFTYLEETFKSVTSARNLNLNLNKYLKPELGNAGSWEILIASLAAQKTLVGKELLPMKKFIQERAAIERKVIAIKKNAKNQLQLQTKIFKLLESNSIFTKKQIKTLKVLIKLEIKKGKMSADDMQKLFNEGLLEITLHFYLGLIANIESGIILKGNKEHRYYNEGFLSQFFPKIESYNNEVNTSSMFEGFLEYLYKYNGIKSWYELAKHIPIDKESDNSSGRSLHERQKDLLDTWRKRESFPSIEKLNLLFINITKEDADVFFSNEIAIAKICIQADKQIMKYLGKLQKEANLSLEQLTNILDGLKENYLQQWLIARDNY